MFTIKKAFTMLELVFVIVILGILAAVALPRLWVTRDDAAVAKLRADVATIRTAITTQYSKNIMEGNNSCPNLEGSDTNTLFEGVLKAYPIKKNTGAVKWNGNGIDYNATLNGKTVSFEYNNSTSANCKFECTNNCNVIGE